MRPHFRFESAVRNHDSVDCCSAPGEAQGLNCAERGRGRVKRARLLLSAIAVGVETLVGVLRCVRREVRLQRETREWAEQRRRAAQSEEREWGIH